MGSELVLGGFDAVTNVVYVDVLLALNLMINFLLLSGAAQLTGISLSPMRAILGAAVGAAGALMIFVPYIGPLLGIVIKLALCGAMVLISSGFGSVGAFLKQSLAVLCVSFIFAGLMLAVYICIGPKWMLFFNGVVYLQIRPLALLLLTAFSYALVEVIGRVTRRRHASEELCLMRIAANGRTVSLTALLDTGNNLVEPFSSLPVVVCAYRDVSAITPDYILDYLGEQRGGESKPGLRLIPFCTIKGSGALPAFRPDSAVFYQKGGVHILCDIYLAITLESVGDERYRAIANPAVMDTAGRHQKISALV